MKGVLFVSVSALSTAALARPLPPPPSAGYKLEQDPMGDMLRSSHTAEQILPPRLTTSG